MHIPATTFQGQVTDVRKAPIIAQNVVTYDVVIAVSNPDLKLFPGMTANARILTTKLDDALKVPNAVLRLHPSAAVLKQVGLSASPAGKQQVYVLQNGKLQAVAGNLWALRWQVHRRNIRRFANGRPGCGEIYHGRNFADQRVLPSPTGASRRAEGPDCEF